MNSTRPVVLCACMGSDHRPSEAIDRALAGLIASGQPFVAVADLCRWAQRGQLPAGLTGGATLLACQPRAVAALVSYACEAGAGDQADADRPEIETIPVETLGGDWAAELAEADLPAGPIGIEPGQVVLLDGPPAELDPIRSQSVIEVLLLEGLTVTRASCPCQVPVAFDYPTVVLAGTRAAEQLATRDGARVVDAEAGSPEDVLAAVRAQRAEAAAVEAPTGPGWFPVIDREACTDCKQCVSFCLFGVYSLREDRAEVAQPGNCKPNCPACARVCPAGAIIFPKHPGAPINGGLADDQPGEVSRVNLAQALQGDLRQTLRDRQSGVTDAADVTRRIQQAMAERRACSCKPSAAEPDQPGQTA